MRAQEAAIDIATEARIITLPGGKPARLRLAMLHDSFL